MEPQASSLVQSGEIGGANGVNNQRVDPSWKRVWQLPELRDAVQSWTLASDAGVLFLLFHSKNLSRKECASIYIILVNNLPYGYSYSIT